VRSAAEAPGAQSRINSICTWSGQRPGEVAGLNLEEEEVFCICFWFFVAILTVSLASRRMERCGTAGQRWEN